MSELDNAIRSGSSLISLEEIARRDGITFTLTVYPDHSCGVTLTDGRGWSKAFDTPSRQHSVQRAYKAIQARALHIANSAPGER